MSTKLKRTMNFLIYQKHKDNPVFKHYCQTWCFNYIGIFFRSKGNCEESCIIPFNVCNRVFYFKSNSQILLLGYFIYIIHKHTYKVFMKSCFHINGYFLLEHLFERSDTLITYASHSSLYKYAWYVFNTFYFKFVYKPF